MHMKDMKNIKKILIAVLCVLAFFIPTYVAIAAYNIAQASPVSEHAIKKMVLSTPGGKDYTFDKDTPAGKEIGGNMISFFMDVNSKANAVSQLPDSVSQLDFLKVTYYSYGKETVYKYYFSTDPEYTYYLDADNKAYRIPSEYATKFLRSDYGQYLYPESSQPVLTISDEKVIPTSASWQYLCYNDEYRAITAETSEEKGTFTTSGGLGLTFDKQPDYVLAKIADSSGNVVFDNTIENINNSALFGSNTTYSVSVNAKWYEGNERTSFGEASYSFNLTVNAPAVFYLNESKIEPGEFVVITAKNVEDVSKVSFASEPDIGYTPTFFKDGELVYAFVPVSYSLETTSEYKFTLTYGASSQDMTVYMQEKTFKSKKLSISSSLVATYYTQASLSEFDEAMKNNYGQSYDVLYWLSDSKLREAVTGKRISAGFGLNITLENGGATYRHPGIDYDVTDGDTVSAALKGKVIFAGDLTLTGKTIIIDHGGGLKSVYAHLSKIDVNTGTVVEKGRAIGSAGSTGFTDGASFHFGLYVYDIPVSPYPLEENGIKLNDVKTDSNS